MTRILFSCQFSVAYGGVQHSMLDLVKHLDRSRFEPLVLCSPGGELPAMAAKENARVLTVGHGIYWNYSPRYPLNTLRDVYAVARQIAKLARTENIRIVHTFDCMVFFAATLARLFLKDLQVIWVDNSFNTYVKPYNRAVQRWCFNRGGQVATISQVRLQQLLAEGFDPARSVVLPCGTDFHLNAPGEAPADHQSQRQSPITVGIIGRIVPVKNFELFVQAARRVADKHPQTRFLIIGRPGNFQDEMEYGQQIIKLISALGLTDRITFQPPADNLPALISKMDVVVSSSHLETFGRTLIEAMAMSKPVVATAVGGVPEVVPDGEAGFLVPPGDTESMANRIIQLIEDPVLRETMGRKGRERVLRHYDMRVIARRWEEIYDRLLQNQSGKAQAVAAAGLV
jgi:glycosyltransferase involved in cell wall biosynthesis